MLGNAGKQDPPDAELSEIGRRRIERRNATGRKSDERWREILQAASRVFRRLGYAQTTLEAVAAEANLNRATLYYYVRTKADLLTALLEGVLVPYSAEITTICALPIDPADKLRLIIGKHAEELEHHPEHFIYLEENVHKIISEGGDFIKAFAREYGERLRCIIIEGMDRGTFRDDLDPTLAMLSISGMLNWIHRWYTPEGPSTLQQIGDTIAEMAIGGLTPPATMSPATPA